jgi:hypothetical protein
MIEDLKGRLNMPAQDLLQMFPLARKMQNLEAPCPDSPLAARKTKTKKRESEMTKNRGYTKANC